MAKLWVQLRDLASVDKVEKMTVETPALTSGLCVHMCVQEEKQSRTRERSEETFRRARSLLPPYVAPVNRFSGLHKCAHPLSHHTGLGRIYDEWSFKYLFFMCMSVLFSPHI